MNQEQIKYIQNYLKDRIKGKYRFSYKSYAIKHNDTDFVFESVGLYNISLIGDKNIMSYSFTTDKSYCSCGKTNCEHKTNLKSYIYSIIDSKEF